MVDTYDLQIAFHEEVIEIEPAERRVRRGDCDVGLCRTCARRVAAPRASGTRGRSSWRSGITTIPNYLGVPGEDAAARVALLHRAHPYYRQRVVVVGGKNSAAEAALELFRARRARHARAPPARRSATSIKYWVRPDIENRIKEGSVDRAFQHARGRNHAAARSSSIGRGAAAEEIPADGVFLLTGYKPDVDLMRRAGVRVRQ